VDELLAQLGGSACGWDPKEHAAYMRLRVQCLGAPALGAQVLAPPALGVPSLGGSALTAPSPGASGREPPRAHVGGWSLTSTPRLLEGSSAPPAPSPAPAPSPKVDLLLERAARELPGQDRASVALHEQAVARREAALHRRREIVAAWRAKRKEKAEAAKAAAEADTARAIAQRARLDVARRRTRCEAEEERQRELEAWRQAKTDEHFAKADAERREAEAAKARVALELERRARIRDALSARAMHRAAEESALRALQERQRKDLAAATAKEQQRARLAMQQRDAEAAERRRHAAEVRQAAAERREQRLRELAEAAKPRAARTAVRDVERLTRPTQAQALRRDEVVKTAAERRVEAGVPSRFGSSSLTFAAAGGRAVPGWRNGI
jgi:hypothetical protein